MAFLDSMNVSASALTASRLRMDVIAENMANSSTTRTAEGGPYRRKFVVYQEIKPDNSFATFFNRASTSYGGVRVTMIGEDQSEFKLDYNPNHPDADEFGYVRMPNVEVVQEMVDMMSAYRAYEANITALNTFKDMASKTLEIGR
ncbi:MAG: flagellar basal body rod protein FlgC [Oscillospiraceae bacterium]|jgi:flagellar basal-body rod protein FlgC|nr:flagellar basal body rod protein FlgC [Oscillospiraceae bacterium]